MELEFKKKRNVVNEHITCPPPNAGPLCRSVQRSDCPYLYLYSELSGREKIGVASLTSKFFVCFPSEYIRTLSLFPCGLTMEEKKTKTQLGCTSISREIKESIRLNHRDRDQAATKDERMNAVDESRTSSSVLYALLLPRPRPTSLPFIQLNVAGRVKISNDRDG